MHLSPVESTFPSVTGIHLTILPSPGHLTNLRRCCWVLAVLTCLVNRQLRAETIQFGSTDVVGTTIQVGAATISGTPSWGPTGQPANVMGFGLGSAAIGDSYSIDRQIHFSAGSFNPDLDLSEGLSLSVNGTIRSITLAPELTIFETAETLLLPFQVMIYPSDRPPGSSCTLPLMPYWANLDSHSGSITYEGPFSSSDISAFTINLTQATDPVVGLYASLESRGFPDATVQFSVRIEAIDYTPMVTAVPEPTTTALVGLGLLAMGWHRRRSRMR
jgi:hypothetical protein